MLATNEIKTIQDYVTQKPVALVYLFGSQATGEVGPMSDYDFAVLFDQSVSSSERFDLKLDLINLFSGVVRTDKVDVVDLNAGQTSFAFEATTKGICLFGNKQAQDDFEFRTFQTFQDQRFYLKRYADQTITRIAASGFN